ncbi:hypothetical protein AWJ20_3431 [Sugiyamaella lignohabitans]|uniref:Uncharacterized protein n=1 Tax=Sugiyamaella lignohabitans TaxID=796027 RepID=A0A161HNN8_9ASCO|nr:uncharacterized protein AWJ20_3431 [Sugiyamaella lignohabitans]ANB15787.1 hypothetical protein AWJ20_3431 [Sugiyamaella lignohabitans]
MAPPTGEGVSGSRAWSQQIIPPATSTAPPVQVPSSSSIARSPSNSPRLTPFGSSLSSSLRNRVGNGHRQKALSVSGLLSVPELTPVEEGMTKNTIYKVPAFASSSIDIRTGNFHGPDPSDVKERPLLAPFKTYQQPSAKISPSSYFDLDHTGGNGMNSPTSPQLEFGTFASSGSQSPLANPNPVQFSRIKSSPSLALDDEMRRGILPSRKRPPGPSNLFHTNGPSPVIRTSKIPDILVSNDTDSSDTGSNSSGPTFPFSHGSNSVLLSDPFSRRHSSFSGTAFSTGLTNEFTAPNSKSIGGANLDNKGNVSMAQSVEELQKSLGGDVVVKLDAVEDILKARMRSFEQHLAGIRSLRNRSNELLLTFRAHASQSHEDFSLYSQKYKELDFSEFDDLEKRVLASADKVDEYSQRLKLVNERISEQERENHTRQLRYKFIRRSLASICLFILLLITILRFLESSYHISSYYKSLFAKGPPLDSLPANGIAGDLAPLNQKGQEFGLTAIDKHYL